MGKELAGDVMGQISSTPPPMEEPEKLSSALGAHTLGLLLLAPPLVHFTLDLSTLSMRPPSHPQPEGTRTEGGHCFL